MSDPRRAAVHVLHCRCSSGHYGPEQALDQLVPALVRRDVVPRVLAVYRRPADGPVVHPWVTDLRDRGIRADQIVDPGPMSLDVVRQMVQRVRRDSCDVLHTHDYKSNLLGGLAARRADAALPWIATVHLHTEATRRLRIYRALDLFLLRLADRVITVSREQQRLLRRRGVEPRRLVLVPNVIDVDAFRAGAGRPDRARSAVGLPRQGPVVAAVGRLAHQKGLDLFLAAAVGIRRQRPDCRFVIAGSGPLRPALERQVDLSGLRDCVHLVGYRADVARLLLACDVVVLPSRSEGMPLVLLEALAMARPVVAARVGGVPEVLRDGRDGLLIEPGSATELEAAVVRLLADPAWAARLGSAGELRVRRLHAPDRAARRLAAVYRGVLEERAS